jgi:hypothetical protein
MRIRLPSRFWSWDLALGRQRKLSQEVIGQEYAKLHNNHFGVCRTAQTFNGRRVFVGSLVERTASRYALSRHRFPACERAAQGRPCVFQGFTLAAGPRKSIVISAASGEVEVAKGPFMCIANATARSKKASIHRGRCRTAAIVWLILTQIIASTMGGYLAARLRTKWVNIHTDEVHFHDTVHGFLVWAVGLVITAGF